MKKIIEGWFFSILLVILGSFMIITSAGFRDDLFGVAGLSTGMWGLGKKIRQLKNKKHWEEEEIGEHNS
jgi:hypothetical protein